MAWWPTLTFLVFYYWPYLVIASLIGLAVGWFSLSPAEKSGTPK
ncbi:hypothetical protein [Devosia rhizoryzae]|nr:hypothetical protein [Devosia rhizoryzae]